MYKCLTCEVEKSLDTCAYVKWNYAHTERIGRICNKCSGKINRQISKALGMAVRLKEDIVEIEERIGLTV